MATPQLAHLTVKQLNKATSLKEKIEALELQLTRILGVSSADSEVKDAKATRKMSAAGKARIAAAQRSRWAAFRRSKGTARPAPKAKRRLTPEMRQRLSKLASRRWAKARSAGKATLAA